MVRFERVMISLNDNSYQRDFSAEGQVCTVRPLVGPFTHLVFLRSQTILWTKKRSCHSATCLEAPLSQTAKAHSISMALFVLKQLTIIEKFT